MWLLQRGGCFTGGIWFWQLGCFLPCFVGCFSVPGKNSPAAPPSPRLFLAAGAVLGWVCAAAGSSFKYANTFFILKVKDGSKAHLFLSSCRVFGFIFCPSFYVRLLDLSLKAAWNKYFIFNSFKSSGRWLLILTEIGSSLMEVLLCFSLPFNWAVVEQPLPGLVMPVRVWCWKNDLGEENEWVTKCHRLYFQGFGFSLTL